MPGGRVAPYGAIGPGIFVTVVDVEGPGFELDAAAANVGLDARAGLNVQLTELIGVFVEYRYTSYEAELDDDPLGVDVDVEAELDSHHVTAGLGFHF